MDEKELSDLRAVLNISNGSGFRVILKLLNELGAFETGVRADSSTKEDYLTLGKRAKGAWLLECVYKADEKKFLEMLKKKDEV